MNFNLKNTQDVNAELKRQAQVIEDIEFLHKLKFCFEVYEIIKNTDMEAVKIAYTKNEYNDEGLDCGAYFDYRTKTVDYCGDYLDESQEYSEKIGESWGSSESSEDAQEVYKKNEEPLKKLNTLASNLYGTTEKLSYLIDELENKELKNNIDKIVLAVCGKNGLDKWKISIEKEEISEAVPASKKPVVKTKQVKV